MPTVNDIASHLEQLAPLATAEEWDNVGLLVGDRARAVERLMTCLTLTPTTVAEALKARAEMVVVHHPLPFRPLSRLTTDTTSGQLLWQLIGAGISVYSAHTAFDSARDGINQQWAVGLGLREIEPLSSHEDGFEKRAGINLGSGRRGVLSSPLNLAAVAGMVKTFFSLAHVRVVGDDDRIVERVGVACGSGGTFLAAARVKACDCLITGETSFHTCLEAEAIGIGLILCGHFASERFAMERLAGDLGQAFPNIQVWASRTERDPLRAL